MTVAGDFVTALQSERRIGNSSQRGLSDFPMTMAKGAMC